MPVISRASIQNLKARVDIVDVVSAVVSLKRAGSKFKGLSPFNAEKTPSFFVTPDRGLYKCFSSGKAGDIISFVMETEQLGFTEAVEALARRFNVPLEYESGGVSREERTLRQELFDLHEEAMEVYREAFLAPGRGGDFIRNYWTESRRFDAAVAEDFKIGFAEPDGGRLMDRLRKRGFSDAALRQCGLFFARESGPLPVRFRGRLMIPIRDHQGRVVAFTARQLEVTPADDPTREAKYVNSPETPIFTKGQVLFNLDRARKHAGAGHPFLMVEGQLDAIRCWTAGLATAIAPQGTGVTDTQLHLLHRYHAGVECLLDGDSAGQRAALRLLPLALAEGLEMVFLPLPDRTDPDDLIREGGAEAIANLRNRRLSAMRFAVSALAPDPTVLSAQQRADVARELFAIIAHAGSEVAKSEYLAEAAAVLGLERSAFSEDFRRFRARQSVRAFAAPGSSPTPPPPHDRRMPVEATSVAATPGQGSLITVEHDLLLLILQHEEIGRHLSGVVQHEWIDTATRGGRLLDRFLHDFSHDVWPGINELDRHVDDPEERNFLDSILFDPPPIEDPFKVANEGIRRMVRNFCVSKIDKIELEIARKAGNVDADLLSLRKTIEDLHHLRLNPPVLSPSA